MTDPETPDESAPVEGSHTPEEAPLAPEATADPVVPPAAQAEVALPEGATQPTGDALFDALWEKVLTSWEEDKAHGAVLEYAVTAEKLPDLAGRYRVLKDVPSRAERAQKRLDAIILAATQLMMSMRSPANTSIPLPITLSVAGLFACAVAFVAYAMLHR